jgi:hypothetical protein
MAKPSRPTARHPPGTGQPRRRVFLRIPAWARSVVVLVGRADGGRPAEPPPPRRRLIRVGERLRAAWGRAAAGPAGRWGAAGLLLAVAFGLGRACAGPAAEPPPPERPPAERPAPPALPGTPEPAGLPSPEAEVHPAEELPDGSHEVDCIRKPDRSTKKRIAAIGGRSADGTPWLVDLDTAIAGIENDRWHFHVGRGTTEVEVLIDTGRSGQPYLTTEPDGRKDNNLLELQECP